MHIQQIWKSSLFIFLAAFYLTACDADQNPEDTDAEEKTEEMMEEAENRDGEFDETEIYYTSAIEGELMPKDDNYTYAYLNDDNTVEAIQTRTAQVEGDDKTIERRKDAVYGEGEVDSAPLFSMACKTAEDPEDCNNDAIKKYIKENLDYPATAERKGTESVEQVVFVVDENGNVVDNDVRVVSRGDDDCNACARAAVNAIKEMPTWQPAMRNGKAVRVRMVLPVRFEIIQ